MKKHVKVKSAGFSIAEILLAMTLLGVASILVSRFIRESTITHMVNKGRSEAMRLARDRCENIKTRPYNGVAVSTTLAPIPGLTASAENEYDSVNYPAEERKEGGLTFFRYDRVDRLDDDGAGGLIPVAWSVGETGLKLFSTVLVWEVAGGRRSQRLEQVLKVPGESSGSPAYNCWAEGTVRHGTGVLAAGAVVESFYGNDKAAVTRYATVADNSGRYRILVPGGNTSSRIYVTSAPYSETFVTAPHCAAGSSVVPLDIVIPSTAVWRWKKVLLNVWGPNPRISRVVGARQRPDGFVEEYVMAYWPNGKTVSDLGLRFQRSPCAGTGCGTGTDEIAYDIDLIAFASSVNFDASYVVFANTKTLVFNSVNINANYYWNTALTSSNHTYFGSSNRRTGNTEFTAENPNIIPVYEDNYDGTSHEGNGSLQLYRKSDGFVIDSFAWSGGGAGAPLPPLPPPPGLTEGQYYEDAVPEGLRAGDEFIRFATPAGVDDGVWGAAPVWDSNNNRADWGRQPLYYWNTDNWKPMGKGVLVGETGLTYTGPPTVYIARNRGPSEYPTIGLTYNFRENFRLSQTTPAFTQAVFEDAPLADSTVDSGYFVSYLPSGYNYIKREWEGPGPAFGFAYRMDQALSAPTPLYTGRVILASGNRFPGMLYGWAYTGAGLISPIQTEYSKLRFLTKNPDEYFFLDWSSTNDPTHFLIEGSGYRILSSSPPWRVDVSGPGNYDLLLFDGPVVRGRITDSTGAGLSGEAISVARELNAYEAKTNTGFDGQYEFVLPGAGNYTLMPMNGTFSPLSRTVSLPSAELVMAGDFVRTADAADGDSYTPPNYGRVEGSVSLNGAPIPTGVVILVTTTTLTPSVENPTGMPVLNEAARQAGTGYYMGTSDREGRFSLPVLPGVGYKVYGWHVAVKEGAVQTTLRTTGGLTVSAGAILGGIDLQW